MSAIQTKKTHGLRNKNVVIGNQIVRSHQSLNLSEKRILTAAIAKMSNKTGPVKITAQEYADTFNLPIKQAYEQLKKASANIFNRYLSFSISDSQEKNQTHWKVRWLSSYAYQDGEGYLILNFNSEIAPYLLDMSEHFTQYKLREACDLRSSHSWRMLELIQQMRGKKTDGWLDIGIDDFHHAMESKESYRKNFNNLRKYVIEPAIKELQEKRNWHIEWKPLKESGRRVSKLSFRITEVLTD